MLTCRLRLAAAQLESVSWALGVLGRRCLIALLDAWDVLAGRLPEGPVFGPLPQPRPREVTYLAGHSGTPRIPRYYYERQAAA